MHRCILSLQYDHPATRSRSCSWWCSGAITDLLPNLPLASLGFTPAGFEKRQKVCSLQLLKMINKAPAVPPFSFLEIYFDRILGNHRQRSVLSRQRAILQASKSTCRQLLSPKVGEKDMHTIKLQAMKTRWELNQPENLSGTRHKHISLYLSN